MGNAESTEENEAHRPLNEEQAFPSWFGGGNKEKPTSSSKPTTAQPGSQGRGALGGLQEKLTSSVTKAGQAIGVVEKQRTMEDEVCEMCPKLSMKQRVAGFCAMCGLGYMLSIMGTLLLAKGYSDKNVRAFAELYIAGNVVAILATALFVGPRKLCHRMTEKHRRVGTAIWFSLMIGIFVAALLKAPLPIVLGLLVLETLAGIWYAASYVPFGRRVIISCCQSSLFSPCPEVLKPVASQV